MLNRTQLINEIEVMAGKTIEQAIHKMNTVACTQTLNSLRVHICEAYKNDFIMLCNDLGLGLRKIVHSNGDLQKRARQSWRRSFAYIKKDGTVTGALNKVFSKEGFVIDYKGDSPAWVELPKPEVVQTTETEFDKFDSIIANLESLGISQATQDRILDMIALEIENSENDIDNAINGDLAVETIGEVQLEQVV